MINSNNRFLSNPARAAVPRRSLAVPAVALCEGWGEAWALACPPKPPKGEGWEHVLNSIIYLEKQDK